MKKFCIEKSNIEAYEIPLSQLSKVLFGGSEIIHASFIHLEGEEEISKNDDRNALRVEVRKCHIEKITR